MHHSACCNPPPQPTFKSSGGNRDSSIPALLLLSVITCRLGDVASPSLQHSSSFNLLDKSKSFYYCWFYLLLFPFYSAPCPRLLKCLMFVFVDLMMLCGSANVSQNLISAVFCSPCETFIYPTCSLLLYSCSAIFRVILKTENEHFLTERQVWMRL